MKHAGKARQAGWKLIVWTFFGLLLFVVGGALAVVVGSIVTAAATALFLLWAVFALFCVNFFRDPDPVVPADLDAIVSPAHGKVDVIDEIEESGFMGGRCRRISIFLSVLDVHVQNAPVAGKIEYLKHCPGKFINAMRTDCATENENVLIGIVPTAAPQEKTGVRLIAGLLARRIVPWISLGDEVDKGERTSLIQFGSRVELYLPMSARVTVALGSKVKGGTSVVARRS